MRASWVAVLTVLVGVGAIGAGCELASRRPSRDEVRSYDLAPQSGYLADGPTDAADYAVPTSPEAGEAFDEATYRAAIQKDLARINALLTENERLRQELAAVQSALTEARGEMDTLRGRIAALEEKLARAEARAARQSQVKTDPQ
jgi:BMFP domain-containing protein YqiC